MRCFRYPDLESLQAIIANALASHQQYSRLQTTILSLQQANSELDRELGIQVEQYIRSEANEENEVYKTLDRKLHRYINKYNELTDNSNLAVPNVDGDIEIVSFGDKTNDLSSHKRIEDNNVKYNQLAHVQVDYCSNRINEYDSIDKNADPLKGVKMPADIISVTETRIITDKVVDQNKVDENMAVLPYLTLLSKYRKLYRLLCREANIFLDLTLASVDAKTSKSKTKVSRDDFDVSLSTDALNAVTLQLSPIAIRNVDDVNDNDMVIKDEEMKSAQVVPMHPALLAPSFMLQDICIKTMSAIRTLLRSEGQAIVIPDEPKEHATSNAKSEYLMSYQVIFTGNGLQFGSNIIPGVFGTVNVGLESDSFISKVMQSHKSVTISSHENDTTYNSIIDGQCDILTPMLFVPIRGNLPMNLCNMMFDNCFIQVKVEVLWQYLLQ